MTLKIKCQKVTLKKNQNDYVYSRDIFMAIIATAPGKAILLGEHFVVYGTGAILCAIQKYTTVSVEMLEVGVQISSRYGSDKFSKGDDPKTVPEHHRPILQIANELGLGVDASIDSEIPPGVGLGSSSAYCVAGAGALLNQSREGVMDMALRAERSVFEGASGADTAVCLAGGVIEFSDQKYESFTECGDIILAVASTGQEHSTSKTVDAVRRNKERDIGRFESTCEQVKGLVGDARSALNSKDLVSLGAHMSQNQKCLSSIGVSDAIIDKIVASAIKTSYGAKLTGAGAGGCVIALVDDSNKSRTLDAMKATGSDAFLVRIDNDGLRIS